MLFQFECYLCHSGFMHDCEYHFVKGWEFPECPKCHVSVPVMAVQKNDRILLKTKFLKVRSCEAATICQKS
jgi:hypothetical protein